MKTFPRCWVNPGGRVDFLEEELRFENPLISAIRRVQALIGITGRKARVGGSAS